MLTAARLDGGCLFETFGGALVVAEHEIVAAREVPFSSALVGDGLKQACACRIIGFFEQHIGSLEIFALPQQSAGERQSQENN